MSSALLARARVDRALPNVLVVEDRTSDFEALARALEGIAALSRARDAITARVALGAPVEWDAVFLDLGLPDVPAASRFALFRELRTRLPRTPIIIYTVDDGVTTVFESARDGAFDFVEKSPGGLARAPRALRQALLFREACAGVLDLAGEADGPMAEIRRQLVVAVRSARDVLLVGQTGSGKTETAKLLHAISDRWAGPFVRVDCATIPPTLFESELFGHRRGSFSGARTDRRGLVAAANGGVLFVDEIGDLPVDLQGKLLELYDHHTYRRVGDDRPTAADVLIVSATHRELAARVASGAFRADLLFRIRKNVIELPSLRERRADVPLLCRVILRRLCARMRREEATLTAGALSALDAYDWPGNLRELEQALAEALAAHPENARLDAADLPVWSRAGVAAAIARSLRRDPGRARDELVDALRASGGNQRAAALRLRVSEGWVRKWSKRWGIERSEWEPPP